MDNVYAHENQDSYVSSFDKTYRCTDLDASDTCINLSPNEFIRCDDRLHQFTATPGPISAQNSKQISDVDVPSLEGNILDKNCDEQGTRSKEDGNGMLYLDPGETYTITRLLRQYQTQLNTNVSARGEYLEGDSEYDGHRYAFLLDNSDGSNRATDSKVKRNQQRPASADPFERYLFNPPKSSRSCPRSGNTPKSQSEITKAEITEVPRSIVYISKQPGIYFQVKFRAKNTTLSPLYVHRRRITQQENEKKIQPEHLAYRDQSRVNEMMAHLSRQRYMLNTGEPTPKTSKSALPPIRVYTDEVPNTRKRTTSEPKRASAHGRLYFLFKGILIHIRTPPLPIVNTKLPIRDDIAAKMAELKMPTSEAKKNKGTIIARNGLDLVQFSFDMEDITLNRAELKETVAVQTEDRMVYIRERSNITGRTLLLALPESTYFYQDPMTPIHRLHAVLQRRDVMPLWKYQLMRSRLADKRGLAETEAKLDKLIKQTRGSRLYFEGFDMLITAQTGLLCFEIESGYDEYEQMMYSYQGEHKPVRRTPQLVLVGSSPGWSIRPQTAESTNPSGASDAAE